MNKIKTSRKIRKEINRMSKVLEYNKTQSVQYLEMFQEMGFSSHGYLQYLKHFMYNSTVSNIYMKEFDKSLLEKSTYTEKILEHKKKVKEKFDKDNDKLAKGEELDEFKPTNLTGNENKFISPRKMARCIATKYPKLWGNRNW